MGKHGKKQQKEFKKVATLKTEEQILENTENIKEKSYSYIDKHYVALKKTIRKTIKNKSLKIHFRSVLHVKNKRYFYEKACKITCFPFYNQIA